MEKFLVVGCGGSGAVTQAYIIDQLKAYLRQVDPERTELPAAWQFVSVDAPLTAEPGPAGLANVPQSGGQYVSVGNSLHYNQFEQGLSQQLARTGSLGEIATWATREPENLNLPIDRGAGQRRALGRMLTIQNLEKIHDGLRSAMDRLNRMETNAELNELNYKITGRRSDVTDSEPIALVIGSMAGGSGASMVFDVARLISTLPGNMPSRTAIFMMSPEVFESLSEDDRRGMWPNSLAMFGEAVAAQTGAAVAHDRAIFKAMGLSVTPKNASFARLFPIGARMGGNRSKFGDGSPAAIYRGLGRALAALMTSRKALGSFTQYTLGNSGASEGSRSILGWGSPTKVSWNDIPWGSMGYAQLSMGRDRYAEYAAQRLARSSFERLLEGHLSPDDPSTGKEQLDKRLRERLPDFLAACHLPGSMAGQLRAADVYPWLGSVFGGSFSAPAANEAVRNIRQTLPAGDGMKSREWADLVRGRLEQCRSGVDEMLSANAYAAVHEFADFFADRVIAEIEGDLSRYGVPFVEEIVDRLMEMFQEPLIPMIKSFAQSAAGMDPMAPSPQLETLLQPLNGRGTVNNSAQIADNIAASYTTQLTQYHIVQVASLLAEVLDDFRSSVLLRLKRELVSVHKDLDHDNERKDVSLNLADVATSDPVAWPRDGEEKIDDRFRSSANEILITETDKFPADYEGHMLGTMRATVPDLRTFPEAVSAATREIIMGDWDTQGGIKAPNDTLCPATGPESGPGNRAGWVSKHLTRPPYGRGEKRDSRAASFNPRLRPADLIERTRLWIARPAKPFSDFIGVDLRSYLTRAAAANDAEYDGRLNRLHDAFYKALHQARPLAAVSSEMLNRVYGVGREQYHFNFSEIPLDGLEAGSRLSEIIQNDTTRDEATVTTFESAFTTDNRVFSIDVFGSYPNYSPVVFSSLFPHIAEDWNGRGGNSESFWELRRARPLPAALPLTNDERRAMVAGWHIGVLTGRIYISGLGTAAAAAHIFDDAQEEWVPFPQKLLTPPTKFRGNEDWMPAVIESVLLAYADVQTAPPGGRIGDSLRPYRLLRELYDDGAEGPTTGAVDHSVVKVLAEWLATGKDPQSDTGTSPHGSTLAERKAKAEEVLRTARAKAANFLSATGRAALPGARPTDRPWSYVVDRRIAAEMPLYRDLADDVDYMAADLLKRLEEAAVVAEDWGREPVAPPQPLITGANDPTLTSRPEGFGGGLI
ncbi:tubulin-like doman-containing protein [Corynebacterium freneyi]|uniref:tubulin-like doman-containing protein n=1 Tax=Corynebacterium freneyi TaxID=134034 RepID=UPI0025514C6D|nr:tubulin-like doman-containing protein [Corynebacterium freneyi]MDK8768016.1 tubulin-like doman-containing protein [Corynebacterium freneyi]